MKTDPEETLATLTKRELFAALILGHIASQTPTHNLSTLKHRKEVANLAVDLAGTLISALNGEK